MLTKEELRNLTKKYKLVKDYIQDEFNIKKDKVKKLTYIMLKHLKEFNGYSLTLFSGYGDKKKVEAGLIISLLQAKELGYLAEGAGYHLEETLVTIIKEDGIELWYII